MSNVSILIAGTRDNMYWVIQSDEYYCVASVERLLKNVRKLCGTSTKLLIPPTCYLCTSECATATAQLHTATKMLLINYW